MRKHIITNVIDAAGDFIDTGKVDIELSVSTLIICIILFLLSALVLFILTRITYLRICDSLNVNNALIKVGTFLIPEIFLTITYISYKRREKKNENNKSVSERKV